MRCPLWSCVVVDGGRREFDGVGQLIVHPFAPRAGNVRNRSLFWGRGMRNSSTGDGYSGGKLGCRRQTRRGRGVMQMSKKAATSATENGLAQATVG